jgi:SAM-dependent methyltransferase
LWPMEHLEDLTPEVGAGMDAERRTSYGPWSLQLWPEDDNAGYLSPIPPYGPDAVHVVIEKAAGQAVWEIQLHQPGPAVAAGQVCVLHFRARAAGRRRMGVGLARSNPPWSDLGLYREVAVTPEWESFREKFTVSADQELTRLVFNLGMEEISVELAAVSFKTVDGTPLASHPQTSATMPETPTVAPADGPAGTLNRPIRAARSVALRRISSSTLTSEVLARIQEGDFTGDEQSILLGCELQEALRAVMDVPRNRWSRQRYREHFQLYDALPPSRPPLEGATIVDLGCGALNPYGALFMFLMLGARRGIAVDLDEILDVPRAVRALADLAAMMLIDPRAIVADFPITRTEILRNIATFDLPGLAWGELEGIDANRLIYARESVDALSLADGAADFVFSNATLEHLPHAEATVQEMARITRPGGMGVHIVDGSDHWSYGDPSHHQLEFLTDPSQQPLVHGSNRIRPLEFLPMFERHGFEVLSFDPFRRADISEDLLHRFAHPWRDMAPDMLAILDGQICVRRLA